MRLVILLILLIPSLALAEIQLPKPDPKPQIEVISAPVVFDESSAEAWSKISEELLTTTADTVIIELQGYGGQIIEGNAFIRSMVLAEQRGLKVIIDVIGPTYSMHANLVCFATAFKLEPGATLNFHAVAYESTSWGFTKKEYALDKASLDLEQYFFDQCKSVGLLNDKLINDIEVDHKMVVISPSKDPKSTEQGVTIEDDL
jgi:hypothetical protein